MEPHPTSPCKLYHGHNLTALEVVLFKIFLVNPWRLEYLKHLPKALMMHLSSSPHTDLSQNILHDSMKM